MSLGNIFLAVIVVIFGLYALAIVTAMIAFLPWGLVGLVVLFAVGYIVWRVINDHLSNPEDRYYEDNFDR